MGDIGCHPPYFKGAERSRGTLLPSVDDHASPWGPDWVQIDSFSAYQGENQILMPKMGFLHFTPDLGNQSV